MIPVYIDGIGVLGPGLPGWMASRSILTGREPYALSPVPGLHVELLPVTERRRCPLSARWALTVAKEALASGGVAGDGVITVFTSSDGDGAILQSMLTALAAPDPYLSPTTFHNSVHNAAAGYLGIATHSRQASISLCAFDHSFAAGFMEAAASVQVDRYPVLLVAYDLPLPYPLYPLRPYDHGFAVALLLMPERSARSLVRCRIGLCQERCPSPFPAFVPAGLRTNPAAHCLPLLAALARGETCVVRLGYGYHDIQVECQPFVRGEGCVNFGS